MAISLPEVVLPRRRANPKGQAYTATFNPSQAGQTLTLPSFTQHMTDLFETRAAQNSRQLLALMFRQDPDVSATVNAFLSIANTTPRIYAYLEDGTPDPQGQLDVQAMLGSLFRRNDYSTGFEMKLSLKEHCENFRYALLLNGGIAAEWIFDRTLLPINLRHVNLNEIEWLEAQPGQYKPIQKPAQAGGVEINLDIPTFMVKYFRQSPFEAYAQSMFLSCINTIAARTQVINDLYRIMQRVGYPRVHVKVIEKTLRDNMPPQFKTDPVRANEWISQRLSEVANGISNLEADQAYVHFDSVEPNIMNEGGPGKSMDVRAVIEVLNAQNQAALKTMASIIGRGQAGVNTASTEARIFSISAQELNQPIAAMLSEGLTLAMRMSGYAGYIEVEFDPVELRPATELEPMLALKESRMTKALSLGLITDDEYHMEMFNRPAPPGVPKLSGTNFENPGSTVDAGSVSPNSDPLGRSVTSGDNAAARSNGVT